MQIEYTPEFLAKVQAAAPQTTLEDEQGRPYMVTVSVFSNHSGAKVAIPLFQTMDQSDFQSAEALVARHAPAIVRERPTRKRRAGGRRSGAEQIDGSEESDADGEGYYPDDVRETLAVIGVNIALN